METPLKLPVSNNKIRIPVRRRELITRQRLIDELSRQLEKRLLLIVAPAGYGKTSLLVDFAGRCDLPICWLSLDALDREPQRFLRYLIAAISERFADFGRDSLAALESMVSLERDEERMLVTIANEINAQIDEHFLLILDDYHLVGEGSFAGRMISRLLQLTAENVHLLLASRNLPDLPDSPLWVARNQMGGVTFERLSFLPEEIQELFRQNNGLALSLQDAKTIVEQTEGWIAAIHLTQGRTANVPPRMHPLESTRELFDFFSREVLQYQPETTRRFLLMTSQFDEFDIGLCEKVLTPFVEGESFDWPVLFASVRTNNLFSVPLDNDGRWMRYHHLFQHFLRSQLQFEQPALAWHIQQNLALAYEEQESWEEAMTVYARLDDHDNLQRVLIQAESTFIQSGHLLTLQNWLEKVPNSERISRPVLVSLRGAILAAQGDHRQALELFNLAESKLRSPEESEEWIRTLIRRAEVYRQLGQFDRAIADVGRILDITRDSSDLDMQHKFAEAQRIRGLAEYGLGHMREALTWLQNALHSYKALGLWQNVPILETELGVIHRRLGETDMTARYYASALKAWENAGNTGWKARLLNNLGLLYHLTGRLEEARLLLEDASKTAERSGYVQIQANVLISLGDLLTDLSDWDAAYDHYDRALTLATNLGLSLYIFYASLGLARLQRLGGEAMLAFDELKQAELSQVSLGIFEKGLFSLEMGCCWLDMDKVESAAVVFQEAVSLFEHGGNQMEQALAQMWQAVASSIQSPESAGPKLQEILPPAREWGKPTPFMIHAGRAGQWLESRGDDPPFKDPLIMKFFEQARQLRISLADMRSRADPEIGQSKTETPRLEIRTFGEVQVRRDRRLLSLSDWQTREARDLFFFLLQSEPLTKEQIGLEFWPDISTNRLKMRFKINIYRVRKALGQNVIVFEDDRYRFNRGCGYVWDREQIDELLQGLPATDNSERIEQLRQVTDRLRRPYLENLDAEWALADRLRYQEIYRDRMVELATQYLEHDQARPCLETARSLLMSDPLMESAHRLIIQAYASLHDPAGMTLQYRQYQQILMTELGLQPSSEMDALYAQLLDAI